MEEYTFERLWKELNEGYQIYYTYMGKKVPSFKAG